MNNEIHIEPIELKHAASIQKFASDPAIAATTTLPHPYPENGALAWIEDCHKKRDAGETYAFAVLQGDQVIGTCSLLEVTDDAATIGYWIGKPFWGQGYATAAGRQLLRSGFSDLSIEIVHGKCLSHNIGSYKVLEKLGFIFKEAVRTKHSKREHEEECAVFELTREVWADLL